MLDSHLSPRFHQAAGVGLTFETEVLGKPRVGLTFETEVPGTFAEVQGKRRNVLSGSKVSQWFYIGHVLISMCFRIRFERYNDR